MERHFLGEPTAFTHRQSIYLPWCKTWILTAAAWSHNRSSPCCLWAGFGRSRGSASCPWRSRCVQSPTSHWRRVNLHHRRRIRHLLQWRMRELNTLQCTKAAAEGCAGTEAGQKRTGQGQDLSNGLHEEASTEAEMHVCFKII